MSTKKRSSKPGLPSPRSAASNNGSRSPSPRPDDLLQKPHGHHRRNSSVPKITGIEVSDDEEEDTSKYVQLDEQVTQSTTFQDLWRIVRQVSAQSSFAGMVSVLEERSVPFVKAKSVRLVVVEDDCLSRGELRVPLNKGLTGYVYSSHEIVNLREPTKDKRFAPEIDADPAVPALGPVMLLPVVADSNSECTGVKDVIGILIGTRAAGEPNFSRRDCTALYRLGEFAGNTLRNARTLDRAHAKVDQSLQTQRRSQALLDVAHALASENRREKLVSLIVSQVPELLNCDRCTLFFVDQEAKQLVVNRGASQGRPRTLVSWIYGQAIAPELPFKPDDNEIRFSLKSGIAGHVGVTGETINVVDAHDDPRFNPEVDRRTGYRTRSILCMPMLDADDKIIGVVQAINKDPSFPCFTEEDEMLLATFSAQAAVAVRNSDLYEQTQSALNRSDALLEVTNALSRELELGNLIKLISEKVQQLLKAKRCTVFIVDHDKEELFTSDAMSSGMGAALPIDHDKAEMIRFPMGRGIAGNVATTGETLSIPDAYEDDRFNRKMDQETGFRTVSILCMPVRSHRDKIIGVIQVINKIRVDVNGKEHIRPFSLDDEKLLEAFCAQSAVAVENSRLFTETERALNHALADQRNLKFLMQVTKNLFSDLHLSSMIDQMTMQVHHLLKADDCALYLIDPATREFYLAHQEADPSVKRYPFSTGIVGQVAQTGQSVRISAEAYKDPRFHPAVDQRPGHVTHSILCCAITAEQDNKTQVIGVISVRDEKDRGGFEREEENLLKVFAAQASIAIINSQRFSKVLEQSDGKDRDHSAANYLVQSRGMNLGSDDIDSVLFSMDEIKLLNPIGTGSYGEVFRGSVRGKVVAVKKLHMRTLKAEQVDSFCKEASLMCQLHHPNVVMFIGAVTEPQNLCIITEFCARGSLADLLLESDAEMPYRMKLRFLLDAARGMVYLHDSNPIILHRDLKSDNLLVSADWTVKVADFGLTRFLSSNKAMTQVGTPMWMAPEIILGKKYTEKADVYAFGIIIWEVLTRLEPYEDKDPMQIVVEVVNDNLRPKTPAEWKDATLVPLMRDCWDQNPDQRPTFNVVLERLEELVRLEDARLAAAGAASS